MRILLAGGWASGRVIDVPDPAPLQVMVAVTGRPTMPYDGSTYCLPWWSWSDAEHAPKTSETYIPSEDISTSGYPVWTVVVPVVVTVSSVSAAGATGL